MENFNLCIIKPNNNAFSETFIEEHIKRLPGNKKVLWGGAFPIYDDKGRYLIRSKLALLSYLIQKRIFKKLEINVRTKALVNYFKENKIDIVFAEYGMVGAMVTDACRRADVPLVIHYHGADVHHTATVNKYRKLYFDTFKYASAFIAVSNDMVKALEQLGAPAEKIVLASCGVDTGAFPALDIKNTAQNFLSVGRFVPKKSPQSVVKAFAQVVAKHPEAKLWMAGTGPLFEEVKTLIIDLELNDNVILTGAIPSEKVKELLRQSRCYVQHSVTAPDGDKEGTPVSILEAGSSGLAIVSTFHAGIKEAVIHEETGFLVNEHDVDKMAFYMIKIAEDANLAANLGKAEAEHIREHYNINDRIKVLTAVLNNAMHKLPISVSVK